jgi:hypothetical protein
MTAPAAAAITLASVMPTRAPVAGPSARAALLPDALGLLPAPLPDAPPVDDAPAPVPEPVAGGPDVPVPEPGLGAVVGAPETEPRVLVATPVAARIPLLIVDTETQLDELGVKYAVDGVTVVPTVYGTGVPFCEYTPVKYCANVENEVEVPTVATGYQPGGYATSWSQLANVPLLL